MGGNVSSGQNNDELIDNLIESGLIKSNMVERVFRAVDRGIFYLPKFKHLAYRDLAWREGHIHISAPCIYTRVLESLELRANLSFLNIGSGTGYLSTMVGLVLGPYGVNHNIELHADLIDYAREKVGEFVRTGVYFDDFEFCAPRFVQGNFLNLAVPSSSSSSTPENSLEDCHIVNNNNDDDEQQPLLQYDRIYVGAGVSDEHEEFIKSLLKIDGVLIMPLNDCLMKIRRINENLWEKNSIMTVSYASLITDSVNPSKKFSMPKLKPLTLQEICRLKIRQTIRQSIEKDYPDYYKVTREMSTFNKNRHVRISGERRVREYGRAEQDDDEDENQYDLYDSDEDDEFGGDEESGGEGRGGGASSASTTQSSSTMNRFDRIFRPHLGLNISYARFDNQLRLLIGGSGRLTSSNSNRPSPQQENQPITTTTATTSTTESDSQNRSNNNTSTGSKINSNDDDDEPTQEQSSDKLRLSSRSNVVAAETTTSGATTSQEDDDRDGFVEELELRSTNHHNSSSNHNSNSSNSRPSRTRLSWLPILSFRHEDTNELGVLMNVRQVFNINNNNNNNNEANSSNSSSRRSEDGESVVSSTAATVASGRLSTTAQQPLSENLESEIDSEAATTSRQKSSDKRQQYGSASESGFSEESRVSDDKLNLNNNTKRKRNFSNGYNSETDGDRYGFGLSSSDEGVRKYAINSIGMSNDDSTSISAASSVEKTSQTLANLKEDDVTSKEETAALSILESKPSVRSLSSSASSSSTDYHDNEECCNDETFRNSDDEETKQTNNGCNQQRRELDDALEEYADAIADEAEEAAIAAAATAAANPQHRMEEAADHLERAVSEILGENTIAAKNNSAGEVNPSSNSVSTRENHLRARIMQLPLSPQVKSFLLYYREI